MNFLSRRNRDYRYVYFGFGQVSEIKTFSGPFLGKYTEVTSIDLQYTISEIFSNAQKVPFDNFENVYKW